MAKRIVIAGGTGFIGRHLARMLVARGDEVTVLTRDPERNDNRIVQGARAVAWDPGGDDGDGRNGGGDDSEGRDGGAGPDARAATGRSADFLAALGGADAVVCVTGEQAVGRRYDEALKRRIRSSRIDVTKDLVEAIGRVDRRPATLVSASGVGYYGAHPASIALDEAAAAGDDFLARVCVDWEAAARAAEPLGARVVVARFGIVLGAGGGALEQMTRPFRFFVGGPIGTGEQAFSFVHIDDVASALAFCIDLATISGPVNVAAPRCVTNAELSRAIGRALGRPSWLPVPGFALKALFGREGAEPLLTGQCAHPVVLEKSGFRFQYPDIESVLDAALKSRASAQDSKS